MEDGECLLIGWLLGNVVCCVLDVEFNLLLVGVVGELCIGGLGLVCGYLGCLVLSVECFVVDLFLVDGECLYCIGDCVCWNVDGVLEYFGCFD